MIFHDDITSLFPGVYSRYIKGNRLTDLVSSFNSKSSSMLSVVYRDNRVACAMLVSNVAVTVFHSEYCAFNDLLELRSELEEEAVAN